MDEKHKITQSNFRRNPMVKKRFRNKTLDELRKLENKVRSQFGKPGRDIIFQENLGESEKMSDVIDDFLAPYEHIANSTQEYRNLIALGMIAWNAALAQGPKRETMLSEMLSSLTPKNDKQMQKDFYAIIREMIERKEKYFANNHRYIMNFQLTETPTGLHLSIASTLEDTPSH